MTNGRIRNVKEYKTLLTKRRETKEYNTCLMIIKINNTLSS